MVSEEHSPLSIKDFIEDLFIYLWLLFRDNHHFQHDHSQAKCDHVLC